MEILLGVFIIRDVRTEKNEGMNGKAVEVTEYSEVCSSLGYLSMIQEFLLLCLKHWLYLCTSTCRTTAALPCHLPTLFLFHMYRHVGVGQQRPASMTGRPFI